MKNGQYWNDFKRIGGQFQGQSKFSENLEGNQALQEIICYERSRKYNPTFIGTHVYHLIGRGEEFATTYSGAVVYHDGGRRTMGTLAIIPEQLGSRIRLKGKEVFRTIFNFHDTTRSLDAKLPSPDLEVPVRLLAHDNSYIKLLDKEISKLNLEESKVGIVE